MDAWYDEDEEIFGHLRDPYHRVDVRRTSQHVTVAAGDQVQAESTRAKVLSETGLPNRYYIPADDVHTDLLEDCCANVSRSGSGIARWRRQWSPCRASPWNTLRA